MVIHFNKVYNILKDSVFKIKRNVGYFVTDKQDSWNKAVAATAAHHVLFV